MAGSQETSTDRQMAESGPGCRVRNHSSVPVPVTLTPAPCPVSQVSLFRTSLPGS